MFSALVEQCGVLHFLCDFCIDLDRVLIHSFDEFSVGFDSSREQGESCLLLCFPPLAPIVPPSVGKVTGSGRGEEGKVEGREWEAFCQQLFAGLSFLQGMTFTLDGFSNVGFCWLVWVRVGGGRVW